MEINLGFGYLGLPSLPVTIISILVIFLLIRWSKQLETRRFTVFLYFLLSVYIAPVYSQSTRNGHFELWLPVGFILIALYLYGKKEYHPSKIKASILGFCLAVYLLVLQYAG